mgnify:CR=1 FL=1
MIVIHPRTVKQKDGFRPFQKQTLEALKSQSKLILVEAPVGAGKSHIIYQMLQDNQISKHPIILTYPTKILIQSQINFLKNKKFNIKHWPDDQQINADLTLFEYSSDALVRYLKKHPEILSIDKSEIIYQILKNHGFTARKNVIVTTPDVLHILKEGWYKGAQRIRSLINQSIVVFDEFHLYTNLANFVPLVKWLLEFIAKKVIFFSATPTFNEDLNALLKEYPSEIIEFNDSVGNESDVIFNYPLELYIEECKYTKHDIMIECLNTYLPNLPKPVAVIFDSVFRLRHLKPILQQQFYDKFKIVEYSGMKKDSIVLDDKTIVLGTASIEVGVEMPFKSLITEVAYWTSAIQRIGRVGRLSPGKVVVLTRKRLFPYLKGRQELTRNEFEEVLRQGLKERMGTMVAGEMFRGNSYAFLVIDKTQKNEVTPYTESIFSMFDIEEDFVVTNWRELDEKEKREILQDEFYLKNEVISEIILRDKIFPFWGVVTGRLKQEYENVTARLTQHELVIELKNSGKTYYFAREGLT